MVAFQWRGIAMRTDRIVYLAVLGCLVSLATQSVAQTRQVKASIELFTSQACSSCPPADKVIGELARDPQVVALSLPVDIWDYLGWRDTLALKGHTNRQKAYAQSRGDLEVYTPQVVVNGVLHMVGSDRSAIDRAIEASKREGTAMQLQLALKIEGDKLAVGVPAGTNPGSPAPAEVWLIPITRKIPVAIERGENRGQTITYNNVVRRWLRLGDWSGNSESYNVSIKDFQNGEIDSVAVIIQGSTNGSPGVMLGAATTPLR
jgi:hypothetical protein